MLQDELSKYIIVHPIATKDAKTIAQTIVEKFILKSGYFKTLRSNNGTEFKNELLKNICDILNISQKFSANYHHLSLGQIYNIENYANEERTCMKHAIEKAKQIIKSEKINRFNKNSEQTISNTLSVGDRVLIRSESRCKQERPYKGPYKVSNVSDNNITVTKIYHKNSLKPYNW